MASKSKTDLEKELKEALKALQGYEASSTAPLDTSWLPVKAQKQISYFLERVRQKRKCTDERTIAACLAWCALQGTKRHGIHRLVEAIEIETHCKI